MHFDILVEDQSGKKALEILVPKIIGEDHTFTVKAYKGIGRIPRNLRASSDPAKRALLTQLPKLLQGYGRTYAGYPNDYRAAVILVCDLDSKCQKFFRKELTAVLNSCTPRPETRFCIAIEEGEAWFLGDIDAVKSAYPEGKDNILATYENDSICHTWEKLADAIYSGGSQKLASEGYHKIGAEKSAWAMNISPHMDVNNNNSPSFCYFRDKLRGLINS
nr:DUF4276 family protein [Desulfobulbaceae bacterium]